MTDGGNLPDLFAMVDEYFPAATAKRDLLEASAYLRAMGEPSMAGDDQPETYRFLLMPSFKPIVSIRIQVGEPASLVHKNFMGSPFKPGTAAFVDESRQLTPEEITLVRDRVKQSAFWSTAEQGRQQGLDGAYWVMEGRRGSQHRVVVRWSPKADGADRAFRELGEFFVGLAGDDCFSTA
jgi:hypothetical protein